MRFPPLSRIPEIPVHVLQGIPVIACMVGYLSTVGELKISLLIASIALSMVALGEMVRRTEAAAAEVGRMAAQLANVHHVGNGDPQATMRAAARWGSDVLGRVARGEAAAEAVAGAALMEMQEGDRVSEAGSAASEQELNGFWNCHHINKGHHSSWIHNALRSVTPTVDGISPREVARMGTVPEEVPYHGQPLIAVPPVRRTHSPPRATTS